MSENDWPKPKRNYVDIPDIPCAIDFENGRWTYCQLGKCCQLFADSKETNEQLAKKFQYSIGEQRALTILKQCPKRPAGEKQ